MKNSNNIIIEKYIINIERMEEKKNLSKNNNNNKLTQ